MRGSSKVELLDFNGLSIGHFEISSIINMENVRLAVPRTKLNWLLLSRSPILIGIIMIYLENLEHPVAYKQK
jgi:hypothetical protein